MSQPISYAHGSLLCPNSCSPTSVSILAELNVSCVAVGLFDIALSLLDAWVQQHAATQPASGSSTSPQEIPRWVDALLLCLDMGMQPQPAAPPQTEQSQAPPAAAAAPASTPAPVAEPATAAPTATPTPAAASSDGVASAGVATPAAAASSSKPQASTSEQTPAVPKRTTEERQQTATQMLRESIRTMFMTNGLLSQQQLEHAASICMKLLHHLHAWSAVWKVPETDPAEADAFSRPEPAASTQAVVQVLARVTKSHKVAVKVRCHVALITALTRHCKCIYSICSWLELTIMSDSSYFTLTFIEVEAKVASCFRKRVKFVHVDWLLQKP